MMKINISNTKITCKIHGLQEAEFALKDKRGLIGTLVCKICLVNNPPRKINVNINPTFK